MSMIHIDQDGQAITDAGSAAITISRRISAKDNAAGAFAVELNNLRGLIADLGGDAAQAGNDLRAACAELASWQDAHPDKFAPALQRQVAAKLRELAVAP